MTMRREKAVGRPEAGRAWTLASANIGNHCGSLVLRRSGRAFSALINLSSNYFFQYVERKFRQYPQNSITQFTMFVVRFLSLAHDYASVRHPFLRDYQSCVLGSFERVVTYLPVDLFNKLSRRSIQDSANGFPRNALFLSFSVVTRITWPLYYSSIVHIAYHASPIWFCLKSVQSKRKN